MVVPQVALVSILELFEPNWSRLIEKQAKRADYVIYFEADRTGGVLMVGVNCQVKSVDVGLQEIPAGFEPKAIAKVWEEQ